MAVVSIITIIIGVLTVYFIYRNEFDGDVKHEFNRIFFTASFALLWVLSLTILWVMLSKN